MPKKVILNKFQFAIVTIKSNSNNKPPPPQPVIGGYIVTRKDTKPIEEVLISICQGLTLLTGEGIQYGYRLGEKVSRDVTGSPEEAMISKMDF